MGSFFCGKAPQRISPGSLPVLPVSEILTLTSSNGRHGAFALGRDVRHPCARRPAPVAPRAFRHAFGTLLYLLPPCASAQCSAMLRAHTVPAPPRTNESLTWRTPTGCYPTTRPSWCTNTCRVRKTSWIFRRARSSTSSTGFRMNGTWSKTPRDLSALSQPIISGRQR